MASARGILNIQSLNELTSRTAPRASRREVREEKTEKTREPRVHVPAPGPRSARPPTSPRAAPVATGFPPTPHPRCTCACSRTLFSEHVSEKLQEQAGITTTYGRCAGPLGLAPRALYAPKSLGTYVECTAKAIDTPTGGGLSTVDSER